MFELLEQRELHLTAIALLSKYLTHENHRQLLSEARGKTKQQLLEMLASRWPHNRRKRTACSSVPHAS